MMTLSRRTVSSRRRVSVSSNISTGIGSFATGVLAQRTMSKELEVGENGLMAKYGRRRIGKPRRGCSKRPHGKRGRKAQLFSSFKHRGKTGAKNPGGLFFCSFMAISGVV